MELENQQSRLKLLIAKGKDQGYLTYHEVNDHLPEGIVDPEQIEDIISMINDMGISVHEVAPDSDFADLISLASQLASFAPQLLDLITADLDGHALEKKKRRVDHERWRVEKTCELIGVPPDPTVEPRLCGGRPRMSPLCSLTFLLLRGWLGGTRAGEPTGGARNASS